MRKTAILASGIFCFFASVNPSFCEERANSYELGFGGGVYCVPGFLFRLGGAQKYPSLLSGEIYTTTALFRLTEKIFWGLELFKASASGSGQWQRDDARARGAKGVASGNSKFDLKGAAINLQYKFLTEKQSLRPYFSGGLGIGWINFDFFGRFNGHLPDGTKIKDEPAQDQTDRVIPIVSAAAGVEWRATKRLGFSGEIFFNTGFGGKIKFLFSF